MTGWGQPLRALLAALAGGALAQAVHLPLAWVLGAMFGVAALSLGTGVPHPLAPAARRLAQGVIGVALGLYFTPPVLAQVFGLAGWIVAGAFAALALSVLAAPVIQRLARMDGPTAIYSVALGASAEMALQAQRAGADGASVASAHAVRIILVTSSATVLASWLGQPLSWVQPAAALLPWGWQCGLLAAAAAAALLLQRLRLPNPWLLGPVVMGALVAAGGRDGRLPEALLVFAQVLIGWGLGQAITREFFARAPRVLASAAAVTVGILALCLLAGAGVARGSGLPLMTAFIALVPGGMAEMGVIAKVFGLGAPVITAFHITRITCTIFLTGALARWMLRSGWVRAQSGG